MHSWAVTTNRIPVREVHLLCAAALTPQASGTTPSLTILVFSSLTEIVRQAREGSWTTTKRADESASGS